MVRGVSRNFLNIAQREQRVGRRTAFLAVGLAPLAAFLGELSDAPGYGPVWSLFVIAVLAGLGAGWVLTRRRLHHYEGDLQVQWNHWMRFSTSSARLADIDRRVHERDPSPAFLGTGLAVALLGVNVALFALLWIEHPAAAVLSWIVMAADGLVLGALITSSALLTRWAKDLARSAEELVQTGEVPLWGER